MLVLLIGCQQTGIGSDEPAKPAGGDTMEAKPDTQLQLYKEALTSKGSSEQMRINAANLLLFSKNPLAREILLSVLKQSENSAARVAVCKALSKARAEQKTVEKREDFLSVLLEILRTEQEFTIAKLAAEATLLFEYEQLSEPLGRILTDPSLPVKARLNAVYALKIHPDKRAVIKLIELVDDPQGQVAAASEKALESLGIPIGKDAKARRQIRDELQRKDEDEFLQGRLIRQETGMRSLENELDWWKKQYLDALDMIYNGISGDTARGKFLAEHLGSSKKIVRLWALEKVSQLRVGTSEWPAELGPVLVNLISNQDRDVRLKTAKLLSLMGELNSAEKLLEQLKIEQDEEVKTEIFVALGAACHYAFLPNSPIKISLEIREQTLEWAAKYLFDTDPKKSQKGAEVIKKLLEQNGVTSADVEIYLGLLAERYEREGGKADGALRGELLSKMAGLCAQGSACKVESAKLFGPIFEEALGDETDLVREAAVDGLIYVDSTRVLKTLRKSLVNDPSIRVRERLINLAGEIGGKDDLVWLWEKMGSTAESGPAWGGMLKIFKRSEAAVLAEWTGRFNLLDTKGRLSDEQMLPVLEIAEQKAVVENKVKMLKDVREKLAGLYKKSGKFEQAADYLGRLHEAAQAPEEKELILADLLDVYLRWPNVEGAARLVDNYLLGKDLESNSPIVLSIDGYLSEPPAGADPNLVVEALLAKIKTAENRPKWQEHLKRWTERLGRVKELSTPEKANN